MTVRQLDIRALENKCTQIRLDLLEEVEVAGSGHYGSCLSAIEIFVSLYYSLLEVRPDEPKWPGRDRFVLSKGHACSAVYPILADLGFFPKSELAKNAEYNAAIALLRRSNGSVGMLGYAMSEENLERILAHPLSMVCSDGSGFAIDGPTRRGSPHPRGAGTFPRVLGRYVRERKVLTLAQAIRKMTSLPAARVRLADRGRIAEGLAADITVFDPATVADTATFDAPFQYPVGMKVVVVNGTVALRDGQRGTVGTGKALRVS